MIYVVASMRVKDAHRDAFLRDAQPLIAATRKEPGCLYYDLTQSVTDPSNFVFVERWESRAALDAHFAAPHLGQWRDACATYVAETKIEIIRPEQIDGA